MIRVKFFHLDRKELTNQIRKKAKKYQNNQNHLIRRIYKQSFDNNIAIPYNAIYERLYEMCKYYEKNTSTEKLLEINTQFKHLTHQMYHIFDDLVKNLIIYNKGLDLVKRILRRFGELLERIVKKRSDSFVDQQPYMFDEMIEHILMFLTQILEKNGIYLSVIFNEYDLKMDSIGSEITRTQIAKIFSDKRMNNLFKMTPKDYEIQKYIKDTYDSIVVYLKKITYVTQRYINGGKQNPHTEFIQTSDNFYYNLKGFFEHARFCKSHVRILGKITNKVDYIVHAMQDFVKMLFIARKYQKNDIKPEEMLTIFFGELVKCFENCRFEIAELLDEQNMNLNDIGKTIEEKQVDGFFNGLQFFYYLLL